MNVFDYPILKSWKQSIYTNCITNEHIRKNGSHQFYDIVHAISDEGQVEPINVPESNRMVIECHKDGQKYFVPIIHEDKLPIKPISWTLCQTKPSDKTVYRFLTTAKSMSIPQDKGDQTFRQFIDTFNMRAHSNNDVWTFLRLTAVASMFKGTKLCICSQPNSGKNANLNVLGYLSGRTVTLSGAPSSAKLYQAVSHNEVVVLDEFTTTAADKMRELESFILKLGDNSVEYSKSTMTIGKQLSEADLLKKSVVFTYNRKKDIGARGTFFDDKWNNIAAFKSRFPQFLLPDSEVLESSTNYSPSQAEKAMEGNRDEINRVAKALSYWVNNLDDHMHGYDRSNIKFKGRKYSNLEGVYDAIDAYCDTQEEFDQWVKRLQEWEQAYYNMVHNKVEYEKPSVEQVKYNKGESKLSKIEKIESDIL